MDNLKLVYIEWVDVVADKETGWKEEEDTSLFFERDDNLVKEVGFIWSEDDDYLYLVVRYMPGDTILSAGRTKVPKKWILYRHDIQSISKPYPCTEDTMSGKSKKDTKK